MNKNSGEATDWVKHLQKIFSVSGRASYEAESILYK
jgi:hypothetical protein